MRPAELDELDDEAGDCGGGGGGGGGDGAEVETTTVATVTAGAVVTVTPALARNVLADDASTSAVARSAWTLDVCAGGVAMRTVMRTDAAVTSTVIALASTFARAANADLIDVLTASVMSETAPEAISSTCTISAYA